jgi:cathepsin L
MDTATFKFVKYISEHGKNYDSIEEFNLRMELFSAMDAEIEEWNMNQSNTSKMGHNKLSDWTAAERAALAGIHGMPEMEFDEVHSYNGTEALAASVNWVTAGKVGAIKDQGQCGSCWAFSATGSVESAIAISENRSPGNYAEQQLVSCSSSYGNNGCGGGWYYWAWNYMKKTAQENTVNYPYTSGKYGITGTCQATSNGVAKVSSYVKVGTSNTDIKSAINMKPVSVALDAERAVFQQYTSGVVTTGCGTTLDHAVMAVGYGTESGQDYFLVRNSWGTWWGDNGYIKIGQSKTGGAPGVCGINSAVYYVNAYTV